MHERPDGDCCPDGRRKKKVELGIKKKKDFLLTYLATSGQVSWNLIFVFFKGI